MTGRRHYRLGPAVLFLAAHAVLLPTGARAQAPPAPTGQEDHRGHGEPADNADHADHADHEGFAGHDDPSERVEPVPPPYAGVAGGLAMPELEGGPITLDDLERRALEHNPEILQAAAQVRAAAGLRRQVGLYPNPVIGFAAEEVSLEEDRDGGKYGGFLAQTVVTGGKLRLNRRIFDREAERAEAVHRLARQRELNRVRILFYRTVAAQRMVDVRARLAGLAAEAVDVTEQLWNTGAADRPDRLAIEIEAETAGLELGEARRSLRQLWAQLRSAVGDPALAAARLEDALEREIPALEEGSVLAAILEGSPETRFAELGLERAQLALRRERAERVPNVEVTAGVLDNREPLSPGGPSLGSELFGDVAIRVPLFDRNQGNVAAAEAEVERAAAERRRTALKIEARFAPVFASYQQELETVTRYRERILPRAEEARRLHLARYRQMAAAYPQVLISQRTLFQAEAAYVESLAQLWESVVLLQGMLLLDDPSPQMLDDAVLRRTPIELASP